MAESKSKKAKSEEKKEKKQDSTVKESSVTAKKPEIIEKTPSDIDSKDEKPLWLRVDRKVLVGGGLAISIFALLVLCVGAAIMYSIFWSKRPVDDVKGLDFVKTDDYGFYYPDNFIETDPTVDDIEIAYADPDETPFRDNINLIISDDDGALVNEEDCEDFRVEVEKAYAQTYSSVSSEPVRFQNDSGVRSCLVRFEITTAGLSFNVEQQVFAERFSNTYYTVTIYYEGDNNRNELRDAMEAFVVR